MSFQQSAKATNARMKRASRMNQQADVDESLFGSKQHSRNGSRGSSKRGSKQASRQGNRQANSSVVSAGQLSKLTGRNPAKDSGCVVISSRELNRIKNGAVILSQKEQATQRSQESLRKEARSTVGRLHKEKMMAAEKRRKNRKPTLGESERIKQRQDELALERANAARGEQHDDVKHMNQMMLYAKCAAVRDAQIEEKKRIKQELIEEEKRLDMAMEMQRIAAIREAEERENVRHIAQLRGKDMIIKQIELRDAARARAQELREQEAQAMLDRIKALEVKEEKERQEKIVAGRKLLEQVLEANNASARAKLRRKQEGVEEDARIAAYIAHKEAREAEQEAELEAIKAEKEKEVARLRALQERAQDRQSQIDELRAKRYQEAKDREWRESQLRAAEKRDGIKKDIARAREDQRAEKASLMAELLVQEREEYSRILATQKEKNDKDARIAREKQLVRIRHRDDILQQINVRAEAKEQDRAAFLSEGKKVTDALEVERQKLLKVKELKMKELAASGVPEKYRAELARAKVMDHAIHS